MCCADDKGSIFTILDLREIVTNCFLFLMLQGNVASGILEWKYLSNLKS